MDHETVGNAILVVLTFLAAFTINMAFVMAIYEITRKK